MAGKGKRKRSEEMIEDVQLSSLPDCLLHHILSFFDMKDVIRTSILSKRWRDLSTSVPNLNFNISSAERRNLSEVGFLRFVERALFANSASKIHKFRLCFSWCYNEKHVSHLDACIRFVMNKGVRELDLDFTTADYRRIGYKLPCLLLNCETLTYLKLRCCRFTVPDIARFTKLTALSLSCMPCTAVNLHDLLKGCPLLEDLVLVGASVIWGPIMYKIIPRLSSLQLKRLTIEGTRYLVTFIEAPNLQILKISSSVYFGHFSLKDMPFLKEAYLDLTFRMGPPSCLDLPFQGLCDARVLRLSSACIQVMPIPTFKDLHFNFKTKLLILRTGVQKYEMPGIANLLWSSPYLENLVIDLVPSNCIYVDKDCELKYDFDAREYWESLTATFPCLLHHLKTIKITGFMGGGSLDSSMEVTSFQEKDEQIKLVKFFLKNAMVLEKMIIHVSNRPEFVDGGQWPEILLGVTQKLVAFPRASSCAEVMPIPTFKDLQFYFKTKVLTLRTGVKKYEMPGIANLLWSSPHLENLIIDLVPSKCIYEDENCLLKDDFDEREYWESLTAIFPCLVHHLKTIKIIGFMGGGSLDSSIKVTSFHEKDEQIKLVRFLLNNAMVLEKMVIHVSDRPEFVKVEEWPKILLGVAQKLVAFPRASADAEVIFSYK